jgi:hypothetical protein
MPHHGFRMRHSEFEQRVCRILRRRKKKKKMSLLQLDNARRERMKKSAYHPTTRSADKFGCRFFLAPTQYICEQRFAEILERD